MCQVSVPNKPCVPTQWDNGQHGVLPFKGHNLVMTVYVHVYVSIHNIMHGEKWLSVCTYSVTEVMYM